MTDPDYPFVAFQFEIQLKITNRGQFGLPETLCYGAFAECDGLEMTMEPKTVREGGNNTQQIQLPGPVAYGNLTLKRGMTRTLDLWKWFNGVAGSAGRDRAAEAVVIIKAADGADQLKFTLSDCLPIKLKAPGLNAKDGQIAIEEMQIAYSTLTITQA
jgi:phage tail-like protein